LIYIKNIRRNKHNKGNTVNNRRKLQMVQHMIHGYVIQDSEVNSVLQMFGLTEDEWKDYRISILLSEVAEKSQELAILQEGI
jgi:hypothetical protein